MGFGSIKNNLISQYRAKRSARWRAQQLLDYHNNGRRPWSNGYNIYREDFITNVIDSPSLMHTFAQGLPLPESYGQYVDERVIELPWALSRITQNHNGSISQILDAGSSLNFLASVDYILKHKHKLSIMTLAPEVNCFWAKAVSYVFDDICHIPFRDNFFSTITCISTLEHIGMDNTQYDPNATVERGTLAQSNTDAFELALSELKRVLKPGGKILISVPFGRYLDNKWHQQFSSNEINRVIDIFKPSQSDTKIYGYEASGWQLSTQEACKDKEYFDIQATKYFKPGSTIDYDSDLAAAARAVALIELVK